MNVFFAKSKLHGSSLITVSAFDCLQLFIKISSENRTQLLYFRTKKKCYFRVVMTKNGYQKWKFRLDLSVIVVNDCLIILPAEKVEKQNYFRAQDSHPYLE